MPTPEIILVEIEGILDELLSMSERLQGLQGGFLSDEEKANLKASQVILVQKLQKMDEAFKKAYKGSTEVKSPIRERIETKLELFKKINDSKKRV